MGCVPAVGVVVDTGRPSESLPVLRQLQCATIQSVCARAPADPRITRLHQVLNPFCSLWNFILDQEPGTFFWKTTRKEVQVWIPTVWTIVN